MSYKTACVVRLGAWGDHIFTTPVYTYLKKDGYHTTAYVNKKGRDVLKNNPYIDEMIIDEEPKRSPDEMKPLFDKIAEGYDKFINLSGSIENGLLLHPLQSEYMWTKEQIHERCNVNYIDRTMELAGYPVKGLNPELFFDENEERITKNFMKKYKGKFVIMWSLSGSSYHKAYPYMEEVAKYLNRYNVQHITVGDDFCRLLEWKDNKTLNKSGEWSMRRSMNLTKYVDLVISTETAMAVAVSCYDTPKIILLSHSGEENLTKYWKNCISLHSDQDCYPCHKLHYSSKSCPEHALTGAAACMGKIKPETLIEAIKSFMEVN